MNRDQAKGTMKDVAGKVQKAFGDARDDADKRREAGK